MYAALRRLWANTSGATAIEYGLIVALICIGLLATADFLGDENSALWMRIGSEVAGAR